MINLGFIGVGGYGRAQVESFLPFHRSGRVRICALADISRAALDVATAFEGLQDAHCFTDYEALLAVDDLDAVVISVPIPFHEETALRAAERGVFVLLEKPPVPLLSQLDRLIAADARGRTMVGFQHVYSPLLQRLKEIAWSGEIGQPLAFVGAGVWPRTTAYYERAGWAGKIFWKDRVTLDGPCTNGMSHFVNSLFFAAGDTPKGYALPTRLEGEVYRARPIASYDLGGMCAELDNGCKFQALFSHAASGAVPVGIHVHGTSGKAALLENNKLLREPSGRTTAGSDGRSELVLAFLEMAEGKAEANLTPLAATRAYVLATNMMFLSSGGIHAIDDSAVTGLPPASPDTVYEVTGFQEVFDAVVEQGVSLRAAGAPWAVQPRIVKQDEYDEAQLLDLLRKS